MKDVVIVDAVRTPVGKRNGCLSEIHALELGSYVLNGLFARTQLDAKLVDFVFWGCVSQVGEQANNIGRQTWLHAGLPLEVPASTIDTQCGSSQQALNLAFGMIASGQHEIVIVGGTESMSRVPMGSNFKNGPGTPTPPTFLERYPVTHQGDSAEMIAKQWGISRAEADAYSLESHRRADHATQCGYFEREIIPIDTVNEVGDPIHVKADEGIRPDTSLEKLANLKPVFREDGIVTAGNASQISDGSAALLLMSAEKAKALGLRPLARIVAQTLVGVDPVLMLTGPIPATKSVLEKARLSLQEIDFIEINEAFASVVLAWQREYDPDMTKVNPHGGAIALGHPLGATGAKLMTTLVHSLITHDKQFGLQTMCCGGGLGTGTIIERLN
ncbi:MAG: acetyl-CoA C-acyltransferase [Phototrophicales bacterium]|nr:MAG: acetyl-CoA C-acyltransferase [Phototrophicales bacterium]